MKIIMVLFSIILFGGLVLAFLWATYIDDFPTEKSPPENQKTIIADTIQIPQIFQVNGTTYSPEINQTDDSPFTTADGSFIDTNNMLRWCAISQDLLQYFKFGDSIFVHSQDEEIIGWWVLHDTMNARIRRTIDFLKPVNSDLHAGDNLLISKVKFYE